MTTDDNRPDGATPEEEAASQELDLRAVELDLRSDELDRRDAELALHSEELGRRDAEVRQLETDALELEESLAQREAALAEQTADLATQRAALGEREAVAGGDFAQQRLDLAAELTTQRSTARDELNVWQLTRQAQVDQELDAHFQLRLAEINATLDAERESQRARLAEARKAWEQSHAAETEKHKALARAVEKKDGELTAKEDHLEGRSQELELRESYLQQRWDSVEDEVTRRTAERLQSLDLREEQVAAEAERLRGELRSQQDLLGAFDDLKRQLGDEDPVRVLASLEAKTTENARLQAELARQPAPETAERLRELESEKVRLSGELTKLREIRVQDEAALRDAQALRLHVSDVESENQTLTRINERLSGEAAQATSELARVRMPFQAEQDEAERRKNIERPLKSAATIGKPPAKPDSPVDEVAWLEAIGTRCAEFGLRFPARILAAFHTALKTAEWSPLTVLSGVSGTGKSELPKLYSHFGGIVFDLVSVQPNWDSQESMLGFFNSIDNKFDAQPLLRFLAQSQQAWTSEYPGLHDAVSLVLLDEMNLAHPELYFAQFLSALEERRSHRGKSVPNLDVKLGAGLREYQLPLGRNVLWAGTMNQDETTKSLSDKVVDRSIMIHFPRPKTLERRIKQNTLEDFPGAPLLHRRTWEEWCAREVDFGREIDPYKSFVEEINAALAVAGRAIGHRVWQSVEFYMANYPAVRAAQRNDDEDALRAAMHVAFEDQLVQKIMPKLRGIETRGATKTLCLDRIESLVVVEGVGGQPFNLARDFELANQLGYGQFIWQSASYLEEDVTEPEQAVVADESVPSTD